MPTKHTRRDILRAGDENPWRHGHSIQIVATFAALLHDLGKATRGFQDKLRNGRQSGDPYRHEWLSLRLFQRMVAGCETDEAWLARLGEWESYRAAHLRWHTEIVVDTKQADGGTCDFSALPPLARWVAWLIVSHHRLPLLKGIDYNACRERRALRENPERALDPADPTAAPRWRKMLARWAHKACHHPPLMALAAQEKTITDPLLLHLSRLCLMSGDHNYSARRRAAATESDPWPEGLVANTLANGVYNQTLKEHLCGVARTSACFARILFTLPTELPGLGRHRKFRARTPDPCFQWQNRAYDLAAGIREQTEKQGFFGVTLASTGTGKTLGNAKILYALADPERGARFTIVLGLRTLTL